MYYNYNSVGLFVSFYEDLSDFIFWDNINKLHYNWIIV